ncbi:MULTISPECIES: spore coat protein GerQ [Bacillus amyloliquefaciens group]|uniref:spore coat protein GerQ n=1 Tax=Bacillus amyloliquefaciens group TaxID=1938374 RepID=UPI00057C180D|nr:MULTISPECIES: spore coat protein GerQ [Bacillus amyloliquefaciens group]MEB3985476.1 spore coat protein GerQ [Bacillus velezensis]POR15415.1 spore coat protein GerQ [Bacillus velezensis]QCE20158.1 spore coat protein GerQ [Bacillus velezensis]UFK56876.1 spore coat protein GerQ [Bacillus amyloliquefaciens]
MKPKKNQYQQMQGMGMGMGMDMQGYQPQLGPNPYPQPQGQGSQMLPMQQQMTMPMQQGQQSFGGGFPGQPQQQGGGSFQIPSGPSSSQNVPGMLPIEESYIENILRLNRGKTATIYMTFENSKEWNSKIFRGVIQAAGRDHIIISDPKTGTRYLLLTIYLDYITFDEEIAYTYPYSMSSYSPR